MGWINRIEVFLTVNLYYQQSNVNMGDKDYF